MISPLGAVEALAGGLLLFFVPGFTVARAVFPERRFRGPAGLRGALELGVLAFVLSVVLTVLAGYVLLSVAPGGFSAGWSSPVLEELLAGIAAVAFAVGALHGAYARTPPAGRAAPGTGEEGAWPVSEELDRLRAEKARRAARLRTRPSSEEAAKLGRELAELDEQEAAIARRREADYDA